MKRRVAWTAESRSDLRSIEKSAALRILHAIARYLATGEADVKRLQDIDPPEYRLRCGDYRVRFHDLGDGIQILAVKHRKDAYR